MSDLLYSQTNVSTRYMVGLCQTDLCSVGLTFYTHKPKFQWGIWHWLVCVKLICVLSTLLLQVLCHLHKQAETFGSLLHCLCVILCWQSRAWQTSKYLFILHTKGVVKVRKIHNETWIFYSFCQKILSLWWAEQLIFPALHFSVWLAKADDTYMYI